MLAILDPAKQFVAVGYLLDPPEQIQMVLRRAADRLPLQLPAFPIDSDDGVSALVRFDAKRT